MFIPFPYYSSSSNCKTIILNGIGYRNETYCGSGVRNLSEIVEYERFELGNTDIDYFCSKYVLSNNTRYWYDEIISGCRLNVLDIVGFVSKIMSIPEERLGAIWVTSSPYHIPNTYCDKWEQDAISNMAFNEYCDLEDYFTKVKFNPFHKYMVISDLGKEGILVAYDLASPVEEIEPNKMLDVNYDKHFC